MKKDDDYDPDMEELFGAVNDDMAGMNLDIDNEYDIQQEAAWERN